LAGAVVSEPGRRPVRLVERHPPVRARLPVGAAGFARGHVRAGQPPRARRHEAGGPRLHHL